MAVRISAQSIGATAWLALAAFLLWAGHDLGIGQPSEPGAGFLIFWSGVLIGLFAGWLFAESFRNEGESLASLWRDTRWGKVAAVVAVLAAYAITLPWLGFLFATVPLMLVLLRAVDPVPWPRTIAVALASTFGVWWVLEHLLSIRLPRGVLD